MLLAELLKDDVKDSLYAKTKDYYVGDDEEFLRKDLNEVYNEGKKAKDQGKPISVNPYKDPPYREEWEKGFKSKDTKDFSVGELLEDILDFSASKDSKSMDSDQEAVFQPSSPRESHKKYIEKIAKIVRKDGDRYTIKFPNGAMFTEVPASDLRFIGFKDSKSIEELVKAGRPQKQAVAIAMKEAGRSRDASDIYFKDIIRKRIKLLDDIQKRLRNAR